LLIYPDYNPDWQSKKSTGRFNQSHETWFHNKTIFKKPIIIVDISCDYNNPNNPIKIYEEATSWEEPVYSYNKYVDIIAINNLPSLLPKDSSNEFSKILVELLLNFNNSVWENNKNIFLNLK
jgi:alanine dehydrogenase